MGDIDFVAAPRIRPNGARNAIPKGPATDCCALHAFQKKAKRGIATPKHEIDLIRQRLKAAQQHYTDTYGEAKGRS